MNGKVKIRLSILMLLTCISNFTCAQQTRIMGVVLSKEGWYHVKDVEVCINADIICLQTNGGGRFYTLIPEDVKVDSIRFSKEGFADTTLYFPDTVPDIIQLFMHHRPRPNQKYYKNEKPFLGAMFTLGIEHTQFGYDDFATYFPAQVIDSMNVNAVRLFFNQKIFINRFQIGFGIGAGGTGNVSDIDTLEVRVGSVFYDLHIAYNAVRTKYVTLGPMTGLKWYRERLLITSGKKEIDLPEYLSTGELDIRFHQLTAFFGGQAFFKLPNDNRYPQINLVLGAYAGYLVPLHTEPWIKSRDNKINASGSLDFPSFTFGVFLGFGRDGYMPKEYDGMLIR